MGFPLRLLATALAASALLVTPASAASGIVAHLTAPTHTPTAGERWPIHISAHDRHGHRVHGTVRYAYLYKGDVVSRAEPKGAKSFVGEFDDHHLAWSKRTIGLELTFRAIVDSHLGQASLDYDVKVAR